MKVNYFISSLIIFTGGVVFSFSGDGFGGSNTGGVNGASAGMISGGGGRAGGGSSGIITGEGGGAGGISGGSTGVITGAGGGTGGGSFEGSGGNGMQKMFVIRHKASGMCLYPKGGGNSKNNIEIILDEKCDDPQAVFKWSKKMSIKSSYFPKYYLFVSEGNLVLHKSKLKSSQLFSFNQESMAFQQNGRYVQPQGNSVEAGTMLVAKKGNFESEWMGFQILGKRRGKLAYCTELAVDSS